MHETACCTPRPRARWASGGAIACTLAATLLPKCPACIVAWLSLLGVGVPLLLAGWVKPLLLSAAAFAGLAAVRRIARARRAPTRARHDQCR
jgi:hypothetical protein